jgi:DNA-binding NtrC family response regulator
VLAAVSLQVHHACTLAEAAVLLARTKARVLLAETQFRGGNWGDALGLLVQQPTRAVLVVAASHADDRLWAETINRGAFDLIARPFYGPEVCRIVGGAYSYAVRGASRPLAAAG